jgi:putative spermidine/putrescine transport system substrate-binding protein
MLTRFVARLVGLVATVLALGLALPGQAQEPRFDGITLRFATFGGGWDKVIHELVGQEFEKRGGKVVYVLAPPREALAKLIAARGQLPFDLFEMDDKTALDAKTGNFLAKIRLDRIPNRKELDADGYDDLKVAAWSVQEGIMYLPEKFKEAGIPAPERYSDLAHPKLQGKVSVADVAAPGSVQILASLAIDGGGSESNLKPAYEQLGRINAARYWKLAAEVQAQIQAGDIWAATMHQGHAVQALNRGMKVAFVHPRTGTKKGVLKPGWLGIVRGTKVQDAAEWFINQYVSAAVQEPLAIKRGVVPVNSVARSRIVTNTTTPLKDLALLKPEEVAGMLRVDVTKFDPNYVEAVSRAVAK